MLWLCLDFPALGREALDADASTAILGAHGSHRWLIADLQTRGRTLPAGTPLKTARSHVPELVTRLRDAAAERSELEAHAHALYRFGSPVVVGTFDLAEPYWLPRWQVFVEIGASLSLFGGHPALREAVLLSLVDWNVAVRCSIAPTRSAAGLMAACGETLPCLTLKELPQCLAALPIATLPWPASQRDALASVGLRTLRELFTLPRAHLLQRFGASAVNGLQALLGERVEPFTAIEPPPVFAVRYGLVGEVENVETLLFPLKRMTQRFAGYLAARGVTALRLQLELRHDLGAPTIIPLALLSPSADAARWFEVLRERLYRTPPDRAVRELHLSADDFLPQTGAQTALFDAHALTRERQTTLEKLIARYGEQALWQPALHADHRPECAARPASALVTAAPAASALQMRARRPLWLLPKSSPIAALPVEDWPERIETGWWDFAPVRRDYHWHAGQWVYRDLDDGAVACAGVFWMSHPREDAPEPTRLDHPVPQPVAPGTPEYAELHCVSNFSFLRGGSHPQELVAQAHANGYGAIAITDECSLAGVVRAWQQTKKTPIDLIVGTELQLSDGPRLLLLAETRAGYARISAAITRARMTLRDPEDKIYDPPDHVIKGQYRIDCETLGTDWQGVAAIWLPDAEPDPTHAAWMAARFGAPCWLAIERALEGDDDARIDTLLRLGREHGLRPVACGDVHYHRPSRRPLQDVLTALRLKTSVPDCGMALLANGERHLQRRETIAQRFDAAWIAESVTIAERCTFDLKRDLEYQYPKELVPAGETQTSYLRRLVDEGVRYRWPEGCDAEILEQIDKELALIAEKKYEAFFLTVEDIVREARRLGILCQGRGSAANSVVCYALRITEVRPADGNMLFERFLSKERHEEPDIDVDFEHQRREEVIQYVFKKYGRQHAALAATVIHYRTKLALRDVGRALGIAPEIVERLSNALAWWDGGEGLADRLTELGFDPNAPQISQWLSLARQLRGFPRHLSQHVGGFVISEGPVHELVPMENASMKDRSIIQWDKDDLEALGLLKVDVLALGMLSALRRMLAFVSQRRGETFGLNELPREDPATYAMIQRAETLGVFQIESRAQMSMLPRLRPKAFYDLVIQIAIVRPGPIEGGMVHPYLNARAQREENDAWKPDYDPRLSRALKRTLGIPIFQEQVMQICSIAADFTPGEADQVRRSMAAWKQGGDLSPFERKLKDGMARNGYPTKFADDIYKMILGFASYGFPESHSASFAILAYASSWMKCHEPAAFIAGLLDSQPMGFYPPTMLVAEAIKMGVTVRPVSVNESDWFSRVAWQRSSRLDDDGDPGTLTLGLNRVSGFNQDAALRIMDARAAAPFRDVEDLAARAKLSRLELDALAKADALQALAGHRHHARWTSLGYIPQRDLLSHIERQEATIAMPAPSEGSEVLADYRSTGLTLRTHPVKLLRPRLARLKVTPNDQLIRTAHKKRLKVAGITMFRQRPPAAKGVMFITLEDETGIVNLIVWAKVLEAYREAAVTGSFLLVDGELQHQDGVTHVVAKRFIDLTAWTGQLPYLSRDFR